MKYSCGLKGTQGATHTSKVARPKVHKNPRGYTNLENFDTCKWVGCMLSKHTYLQIQLISNYSKGHSNFTLSSKTKSTGKIQGVIQFWVVLTPANV